MSFKHFNHKYSGGSPDIPVNIGDSYFSQDMARDFWFIRNEIGKYISTILGQKGTGSLLSRVSLSFPSSGQVSLSAGSGLVLHSVKVPGTPWVIPPPVSNIDSIVRVFWDAISAYTGWTGSPTLDGATVNYVKIRYAETDGATRTRTKKGGSYSYEISPSWSMVIDSSAPTGYDIVVGSFVGTAVDGTAIITQAQDLSLVGYCALIESAASISEPGKYVVGAPGKLITLPASLSVGDVLEFYFNAQGRIVQNHASALIRYKNAQTTKGVYVPTDGSETGYLQMGTYSRVRMFYAGTGLNTLSQPSKLSNPATIPSGTSRHCSYSADGRFFAVVSDSSPYVLIYSVSGNTYTKLADVDVSPPAGVQLSCALSSDGTYLAVGSNVSTYFTIYKRTGLTYAKLADPASMPGTACLGMRFSSDDTYLAMGAGTSPYVHIYKRSGDTFTKLANPGTLPTGAGQDAEFSPDGRYLAIAHGTTPFITIYKRAGDTFTKVTDPGTLPASTASGVSFSQDGLYLAVAHTNTPFVTIYKRSGDTFTKLTNPATLPTNNGNGCSFSPDGSLLAVSMNASPYFYVYSRSGDVFTKLANPTSLPPAISEGCAFNRKDGRHVGVCTNSSPFIHIYECKEELSNTWVVDQLDLAEGAVEADVFK